MTTNFCDWLAGEISFTKTELNSGDYLFRQDDPADAIYGLTDGIICLLRTTAAGQTAVLFRAHAGDCIAEASLQADKYHCFAFCETRVSVKRFSSHVVRDKLAADSNFASEWAARLARQVRDLRSLVECLHYPKAKDRIYHYLLSQADAQGKVALTGSQKTLASILGITHESLYRTLKVLEAQAVIKRDDSRSMITIIGKY